MGLLLYYGILLFLLILPEPLIIIMSSATTFPKQPSAKSLYSAQFSPVYCGNLSTKCADGLFHNHYYQLSLHRLIQYQSQQLKALNLCIDFRAVQLKSFHRFDCHIKIIFDSSKIILKGKTEEQTHAWAEKLAEVIAACADVSPLPISSPTYSEIKITDFQLLKFAETFDILLFKSKNKTAGLQRFVTGSKYDHVGLLLVSETNEVCMIQANAKTGVCLLREKSLRNKIKNSAKVAYRKLLLGNRNDGVVKLEKSLGDFIGCKYEFGVGKLFGGGKKQNKENVKGTYFCSELVVEIYNRCGIMGNGKESSKYWPKDFQQGKGVGNLEFGKTIDVGYEQEP